MIKKIDANQVQHDLCRLTTKILELTTRVLVEQAKCDYFVLGKVFSIGLDKDDKKERLFNWLSNIENESKKQLKAIQDQVEKQSNMLDKKIVWNSREIFLLKDPLDKF